MIEPADNSVEAGILKVWEYLSTGRLKIFSNCVNLVKELRIYRRDEKGRIVKANDHLCDCLRYLTLSGLTVARVKSVPKNKTARLHHSINTDSWLGN